MWPNFGESTILSCMKQLELLSLTWYCHEQRMLFEYFLSSSYNFMYLQHIHSTIEWNFTFSCCFWELNILCVKCAQTVDFPKFSHIYGVQIMEFPWLLLSTCTLFTQIFIAGVLIEWFLYWTLHVAFQANGHQVYKIQQSSHNAMTKNLNCCYELQALLIWFVF